MPGGTRGSASALPAYFPATSLNAGPTTFWLMAWQAVQLLAFSSASGCSDAAAGGAAGAAVVGGAAVGEERRERHLSRVQLDDVDAAARRARQLLRLRAGGGAVGAEGAAIVGVAPRDDAAVLETRGEDILHTRGTWFTHVASRHAQ